MHITTIIGKNSSDRIRHFSSAEASAGYPNKNSNNGKKKKKKARGGPWENGKGGSEASLFSLPIVPCAFSFSFSQRHKVASAEERGIRVRVAKKLTYLFRQQSWHLVRLWSCHSTFCIRYVWVAMTRGEKWAPLGNPLGWISTDHFASNLTV